VQIGFDTYLRVMDVAADTRKLVFAFSIGVLWLIGVGIFGYVGEAMLRGGTAPWLPVVLSVIWTCAMGGVAIGGTSYSVEVELSEHRRARLSEIYNFVMRHILDLGLIVLVMVLGVLLAGLLFNGLYLFLGSIPGVGPILAGLLVIPVFFVNLLLWIMLLFTTLVPCIIGVERLGMVGAVRALVKLLTRHGPRFLAYAAVAGIVVTMVSLFLIVLVLPPFALSSGGSIISSLGGSSFGSPGTMDFSDFFSRLPELVEDSVLPPAAVAHAQWQRQGWQQQQQYSTQEMSGAESFGAWLAGVSTSLLGLALGTFLWVYATACLVVTYRATR
jgi:hypothetical protein